MNNGVPNCPECGGKGMCDKHNLEHLRWCAETAQNKFMEELRIQSRKKEKK